MSSPPFWCYSEFHADAREKTGLCGFVEKPSAFVVHVDIAVACLDEQVACDVNAHGVAGLPSDLRTCFKSAHVSFQGKEKPAREVDLSAQTDDGIPYKK